MKKWVVSLVVAAVMLTGVVSVVAAIKDDVVILGDPGGGVRPK